MGFSRANQLSEVHFFVTVMSQNLRRKNYRGSVGEISTAFACKAALLAGIVQSRGDAIDRGAQRVIQLLGVIP